MANKPKRRRRQPDHREGKKEGILAPSNRLFETIDQEVSLTSSKEDVIARIRNREDLIEVVREILTTGNREKEEKGSRISAEAKSSRVKKLLCALHYASLYVVEAIITINLLHQSIESQDHNSTKSPVAQGGGGSSSPEQGIQTFSWMGKNYLIKMINDLQFICDFEEMMAILLPEKKTLYRNPFLIPLDLDEIVGYEPDVSCLSSKPKTVRMSRVPWEINLQRVKRAACRILFEEHRAIYGDNNVVHVFPKMSKKRGENVVEIELPLPPKLDVLDLEKKIKSTDLSFDDALVIACIRLLLGCDIEGVQVAGNCVAKEAIMKLARQPIQIIVDELSVSSSEGKIIYVEKHVLFTIYSMIMRNLFKTELLMNEISSSIKNLKTWLLRAVSRELSKVVEVGGHLPEDEKIANIAEADDRERADTILCPAVKNTSKSDLNNDGFISKEEGGKGGHFVVAEAETEAEAEREFNVRNDKENICSNSAESMNNINRQDLSPLPIWGRVNTIEGSHKVRVSRKSTINNITCGDVIRIGHPHHSLDYTVTKCGDECFYLNQAFDNSCAIRHQLEQEDEKKSISRLNSPISAKKNNNVHKESSPEQAKSTHNITSTKQQSLKEARMWKVVPLSDDKRLEWRKEYDNGLVPWIPLTSHHGEEEHFRVKINMKDIENNCLDSTGDPNASIHQQRLHYFEKVSLDDIVDETYKTVCQSWHPVTPTIDNTKWAKLARTMKFLSSVKNSNHEVDMAFFRHSYQRKLDIKQFKAVLLDMALQKFSSARYDGGEALANMLWTTVVMIPQVKKMVWSKAQAMAMKVELRRTCAQIRISAQFRMWRQRRVYCHVLHAVVCISKNVRRMIVMSRKQVLLTLANYDRFYRIMQASAVTCQKYWRRYIAVCNFQMHKRLKRKNKEEAGAKIWQKMRVKGLEKSQYLIFREVMNIQSILAVTSMFLRDNMHVGKGIELEIRVYVPEIRRTYSFTLNEEDVRECLERFILRKGPLSWNEILKRDVLVQLRTRLIAKVVGDYPIIVLCRRDIAEKGSLISRQPLVLNESIHILSLYRSPFDIVIRLYNPQACEQLRTKIDLFLLIEWLIEDEEMKKKETLGTFKFCAMVRRKEARDTARGGESPTKRNNTIQHQHLPALLQKDKQADLITWLSKRIQIKRDEVQGRNKIVLQYEAEAERMEMMAKKFQSIWRAKCAKTRARKQVHLQYEKQFDWTTKTFFYIHLKSGVRQWTKPALLRDHEDIADPPDEWRVIDNHDPETGNLSRYYLNPLTGQTSWLSEYEAARIVQRKFRKRQTELLLPSMQHFSQIVRTVTMIRDTELKYEQEPSKLSNRVNFALLCHCLRFDIDKARDLYRDAMAKSSHHPVIARAYGIFILATCKPPLTQSFDKACQLFKQAHTIDPEQKMFQSAKEHFFYWAVLMNPNHPLALLNYALLHQCILGEYYRAEKIYRNALSKDPTNEFLSHNFNLFEDQRYPGGYYAGSGVPNAIVKRSHILEEQRDWGEWKKMKDPLSSKPNFNTFWYNSIDKSSSFEEPKWKEVWKERVQRSKRITTNMKSLWVEYFDDQLQRVFIHNRSSDSYVWQMSK